MRFSNEIYNEIRAGCRESANLIAPMIWHMLHPGRVIDVGAGEGWFASAFARYGCDVIAVDLEDPAVRAPGRFTYMVADVTEMGYVGDFDLAVCVEVAEHLPEEQAKPLVERLCSLAPKVLFSAAIPGQGGHGHLNEQWPVYWAWLFAACDFGTSDDLRWQIWTDERIEPWYRQNLMLYESDNGSKVPPAVVHPAFWRPS